MTTTAVPGQYLLIRRLLSRPDSHTFYLCWAPPDRPATMTYFITIAGRRWPVEETFVLPGFRACGMTSPDPGDLAGGGAVLPGCAARGW